jgi:hypothetical protein
MTDISPRTMTTNWEVIADDKSGERTGTQVRFLRTLAKTKTSVLAVRAMCGPGSLKTCVSRQPYRYTPFFSIHFQLSKKCLNSGISCSGGMYEFETLSFGLQWTLVLGLPLPAYLLSWARGPQRESSAQSLQHGYDPPTQAPKDRHKWHRGLSGIKKRMKPRPHTLSRLERLKGERNTFVLQKLHAYLSPPIYHLSYLMRLMLHILHITPARGQVRDR